MGKQLVKTPIFASAKRQLFDFLPGRPCRITPLGRIGAFPDWRVNQTVIGNRRAHPPKLDIGPEPRGERLIQIFGEAIALTVGTLLPIMNPFSTLPLFMSLTSKADAKSRNRIAFAACLYALALLVSFLFLGTAIIDFFGISVPGIRIAGGLIISAIGFRMLFPDGAPVAGSGKGSHHELEIAFTPLAMPSLAGPGALSVVVTAASQIKSNHPEQYGFVYAGVIVGMVVTALIALAVLRSASPIERVLGPSGIDAMTRIFGFLLVAIGIQFLLTGVSDFFGLRHL